MQKFQILQNEYISDTVLIRLAKASKVILNKSARLFPKYIQFVRFETF